MLIENDKQFAEAVEKCGSINDQIDKLKAEAKVTLELVSYYAKANGLRSCKTENYKMTMAKTAIALKRKGTNTEAEVCDLLAKSKEGKQFLKTTYDADAIKEAYLSDKERDEKLAAFGLYLTDPDAKPKIVALK